MDFSGNRHVEVSPSLVDQPRALRLTIVHALQHLIEIEYESGRREAREHRLTFSARSK